MPAHHDLPEHELTDDELSDMLDYGGKTRTEETRASMGMLAGVFAVLGLALAGAIVALWLIA